MNAVSLIYHDVAPTDASDLSGFGSDTAALYKLTSELFEEHLNVLDRVDGGSLSVWNEIDTDSPGSSAMLTFDDGGASAVRWIAPLLEDHG